MATVAACKHPAYRIVDGDLKCVSCGASSPSRTWEANTYGIEGAKALHGPVEDKALHATAEEKPYTPIVPSGQRRPVGRPAGRR